MRSRTSWLLAAALASSPAAAHCPSGQFYRVRLDRCVAADSGLARAYLAASRPPAARSSALIAALPGPAPEPPKLGADRLDRAEIIHIPFVLPSLDAGAPEIWQLCRAEPKMC